MPFGLQSTVFSNSNQAYTLLGKGDGLEVLRGVFVGLNLLNAFTASSVVRVWTKGVFLHAELGEIDCSIEGQLLVWVYK